MMFSKNAPLIVAAITVILAVIGGGAWLWVRHNAHTEVQARPKCFQRFEGAAESTGANPSATLSLGDISGFMDMYSFMYYIVSIIFFRYFHDELDEGFKEMIERSEIRSDLPGKSGSGK